MKKQLTKLVLLAGFWLAVALTFGCSSDDDGGGDIVNAENEAWAYYDNRQCVGLVFKQNGEFIKLDCDNGRNWCIDVIGDYSISGNQITICDSYDCDAVLSYSISRNILTLVEEGKAYTYTKTSNVNISGDCH